MSSELSMRRRALLLSDRRPRRLPLFKAGPCEINFFNALRGRNLSVSGVFIFSCQGKIADAGGRESS
jgi:hypothetical protein